VSNARRAVYRLALASLRYRAAASLATFMSVLIGCSLLIACGGLFESAIRLNATPQRLAAAPIVIGGSGGFKLPDQESETVPYTERAGVPLDAINKVTAVQGVGRAVPDVSFAAAVVKDGAPLTGGDTVLSGHDWASAGLTPYSLTGGTEPGTPGQVVLDQVTAGDAGVKAGDKIDIVVNGQRMGFTVSGIAQPAQTVAAPALFFSSSDARQFARHPGTVDLIGVFPAEGVDAQELAGRIAGQLPELTVLTDDSRGSAEFVGVDASQLPLILLAGVFGGMVLVVMALVVSATISLSIRQRQQELALLRATGGTPKQVHRMVIVETMAVAALAVVGGVVLGSVMGEVIFALSAGRGVVPAALEFRQGIIPFAGGALIALLTAFVSAWFSALPAARARPIQALTEAAIPPVNVSAFRRQLAKLFALGTAALALLTMFMPAETAGATGGPAGLTGAIAVGLAGPELITFVIARFSGTIRRFAGPQADLAMINARARAVAFAAVLTPITLAVAIALGNVYSQTTRGDAAVSDYVGQFKADAVVSVGAGGVAPDLLKQVSETPGVANASGMVTSLGWIEEPYDGMGSDPTRTVGINANDQASVLDTPVVSGSLRELTGDSVAVPESEADDLGIKVGDQVTLRLGDGARVRAKVAALLDSPSGFPSLVLPVDLLAAHTTTGLPSQILVRAKPDQDASDLVAAIQQRVSGWPGATVGDDSMLTENISAGLDVETWINYLLAVLAIAYAAIAAVNMLAVAVLARRREFAVQRLAGADWRQVRRMLLIEGGLIAVVALVLGTVISLFSIIPMAVSVGSIIPSGPLWVFLAVIIAVFLIVLPVSSTAARMAMKRKPIEAIALPGQ
jgi:putative ABC transport system permease protein